MNTTTFLLRIVNLGMGLGLSVLAGLLAIFAVAYVLERALWLVGVDRRGRTASALHRTAERLPLGLRLALMFPLIALLLGLILLQALGLMRRVPFSYNFRNLLV